MKISVIKLGLTVGIAVNVLAATICAFYYWLPIYAPEFTYQHSPFIAQKLRASCYLDYDDRTTALLLEHRQDKETLVANVIGNLDKNGKIYLLDAFNQITLETQLITNHDQLESKLLDIALNYDNNDLQYYAIEALILFGSHSADKQRLLIQSGDNETVRTYVESTYELYDPENYNFSHSPRLNPWSSEIVDNFFHIIKHDKEVENRDDFLSLLTLAAASTEKDALFFTWVKEHLSDIQELSIKMRSQYIHFYGWGDEYLSPTCLLLLVDPPSFLHQYEYFGPDEYYYKVLTSVEPDTIDSNVINEILDITYWLKDQLDDSDYELATHYDVYPERWTNDVIDLFNKTPFNMDYVYDTEATTEYLLAAGPRVAVDTRAIQDAINRFNTEQQTVLDKFIPRQLKRWHYRQRLTLAIISGNNEELIKLIKDPDSNSPSGKNVLRRIESYPISEQRKFMPTFQHIYGYKNTIINRLISSVNSSMPQIGENKSASVPDLP